MVTEPILEWDREVSLGDQQRLDKLFTIDNFFFTVNSFFIIPNTSLSF